MVNPFRAKRTTRLAENVNGSLTTTQFNFYLGTFLCKKPLCTPRSQVQCFFALNFAYAQESTQSEQLRRSKSVRTLPLTV